MCNGYVHSHIHKRVQMERSEGATVILYPLLTGLVISMPSSTSTVSFTFGSQDAPSRLLEEVSSCHPAMLEKMDSLANSKAALALSLTPLGIDAIEAICDSKDEFAFVFSPYSTAATESPSSSLAATA
mmetsp:Transcript_13717/g.33204  ORF Transcript_13717/g.33204 Transcript_13717/m.33204 type:complete len:128 (-) Transcript_13717:172-555(-)